MSFRLRPIDEREYRELPAGEDLFVHSYGGHRYLYPEPARFVNHADDPSCAQDFDRQRHLALRPIAAGEPITIDARLETARELDTYLEAFRRAAADRSATSLLALVDSDATLWRAGRPHRGRESIVEALLAGEPLQPTALDWQVGTGRWEALCSAAIETPTGPGHLTLLLKIIAGNWQLRYLHHD
nr:SET domain-containing protein [Microlunatus speluncae]